MSKRSRKSPSAEPKRQKLRDIFVPRPFAGLADEPEWIALRELVPAASAPLRLAPEYAQRYGDRPVLLATVLPMAWPAMTKPDGRVFIGLQRHVQSGDVSRDVAVALLRLVAGTAVGHPYLKVLPAGPGADLPGDPDDLAGQRLGVPDRVADQLGDHRDGIGEQFVAGQRTQFTGESVAGHPGTAGVMRNDNAPGAFGDRSPPHVHASPGPRSARGRRTSATVPPRSRGRKDTQPFCLSTIRRTRYNPSPTPP